MNLATLRPEFRGTIITSASPEYESARRLWNGMIDRRPAAILRCTCARDVAAAVRFAAREELYPAIRAGGHNVAGLASVDDGVVIDVSPMKGIIVDPVARTATTEPGLTWGEFDAATQAHGLATTEASTLPRALPDSPSAEVWDGSWDAAASPVTTPLRIR